MPHMNAPRERPIEPADLALVLIGVFFTFAPVGILMQIVPAVPAGPTSIVLGALITGCSSAAWAATFILRRYWWLAIVVPAQLLIPPVLFRTGARMGWLPAAPADAASTYRLAYGIAIVVCIIIGYVLVIRFARAQERRGERARAELDTAAAIHRTLVPPVRLDTGPLEILGASTASTELGGDLLDVLVRPDRIDLCVADVSGHGLRAGLIMGVVKGSLRSALASEASLTAALAELNRVLADTIEPGMFVTAACLRVKPDGHATRLLAGHPPVLLARRNGLGHEVHRLDADDVPLGLTDGSDLAEQPVELRDGDTLLLYTDGITEAADRHGRQFGIARLAETLREHAGRPLRELMDALLAASRSHGPQNDDQTLLLARVRSQQ